MKKALITGITGHIGGHLAELLFDKGYEVHGIVRRTSKPINVLAQTHPGNRHRLKFHSDRLKFHSADLCDQASLNKTMATIQPDEIYNLAAQSFVPTSFAQPELTGDITGLGVTRMLEAMRACCPKARFYQASSSEMFGKVRETPQTELTPFHPRSPYGAAKAYGHWITVNARESYGLYAVSGICFNCEGPNRGAEFVTRKITLAAAAIKKGRQEKLMLGNLDARRDWGFVGDYVDAMWRTLQQEKPDDYVIATGVQHSVREFCEYAFNHVGLDWAKYVFVDPQFHRPAEVDLLVGNPTKIFEKCGWKAITSFRDLVRLMVDADMAGA